MTDFAQGDIIRIGGFRSPFIIVSKNAFIRATGVFHVCPFLSDLEPGPLHIKSIGLLEKTEGTAVCEQIKLIDPEVRGCRRTDRLPYSAIMEISDVLQGIFEYD